MQAHLSAKTRQHTCHFGAAARHLHRKRSTQLRGLPPPRTPQKRPDPVLAPTESIFDTLSSSDDFEAAQPYNTASWADIVRQRTGWLGTFAVGLVAAAFVVEHFESLIEQHVQLSFFVPLIMGQGGNTGSQTVSSIIRALALRQVRWRTGVPVVIKEAVAGGVMGGCLGLVVLVLSLVWSELSTETGIAVAISLPVVSLWANGLAAFVTLASSKLKLDPAMTSGPLVTTFVDVTGLIIYFAVAEAVFKATGQYAT